MDMYNNILFLLILCIIYLFLYFIPSNTSNKCPHLLPIIIVPGLGGSRLHARLNKPETISDACKHKTNRFYLLWLDPNQLLPDPLHCWVDNIKMTYNSSDHKTYNQPGVFTKVKNFGGLKSVEYLGPTVLKGTRALENYEHMRDLIHCFWCIGYKRQQNLFAAPYDFRKGPSELFSFFDDLENLIEREYRKRNASVILIGHSMGGNLILNFLQKKTVEWKDKHIRAFISLNSIFGGTVKSLKTFAAGDDLGMSSLNSEVMIEVFSTFPSMAYLIPNKEIVGNKVLVSTKDKNYTLDNLEDFFKDIGVPDAYKMYQNERKFSDDLSPPGVELYCLYGSGVPTMKKLIYKSGRAKDFPENPTLEYGNGDGTVSLRSLQYCDKVWDQQQTKKVVSKRFRGIDHMTILHDQSSLCYIADIVKKLSKCQNF